MNINNAHKPAGHGLWLALGFLAVSFGLAACQKKNDPAVQTSSTGGASTQSLFTLKGAGQ